MSPSARPALGLRRAAGPGLLLALLLGVALAGCPDTSATAQLCPGNTRAEGTFTTTITARTDAGNDCRVVSSPDGGHPDASIFVAAQTFDSALCSSTGVDGGPVLWFALATRIRLSPLGDGGTFVFGTDNTRFEGTACNCPIFITERIEGTLLAADPDAGLSLSDGGLPPLKGFVGVVRDLVDAGGPLEDAGGLPCYCNTPCVTTYDLTATKL